MRNEDVLVGEEYVTFILADGKHTKIEVPIKTQPLKIGDGTGTLTLTGSTTEIKLTLPGGTTVADYVSLVAQITPEGADGTYTDIATRLLPKEPTVRIRTLLLAPLM